MSVYLIGYRSNEHEMKELYWSQYKEDISKCTRGLFDFYATVDADLNIQAECGVMINGSSYFEIDTSIKVATEGGGDRELVDMVVQALFNRYSNLTTASNIKGIRIKAHPGIPLTSVPSTFEKVFAISKSVNLEVKDNITWVTIPF
jgi:hypothetical protein